MKRRILLVVPPFLSVLRPSLGVSTLAAAVDAERYEVEILYLNMDFAELVGLDDFEWIARRSSPRILAGEWVFSEALRAPAIPDSADDEARFRDRFFDGPDGVPEKRRDAFARARRLAVPFVEESARRIAALEPDLVGFTSSFQQHCAGLAIARAFRTLRPETPIAMGGANCEGPMGRATLRLFPWIDYVFSGESDVTFPEFLDGFFTDGVEPDSKDAPALPANVFAREGRADAARDGRVEDLDRLPVPEFRDYFRRLASASYAEDIVPGLPFEASRGCWWGARKHCKFCGLNGNGMAYRSKSPARVLSEIETLHARWGSNLFEAADNILDMKHVTGVFERLAAEGRPYRFFFEVKSNLNERQLSTLARGGASWIQPGIESLDDRVLELMDKGVTGLQNVGLLRMCKELGVVAVWNLLHGFPGETAESYENLERIVPLVAHLQPPMGLAPVRIDRFSPYFERAEVHGLAPLRPLPAYEEVYRLPPEDLAELAYYFEPETPPPSSVENLERLGEMVRSWGLRYMNRPTRPVLERIDLMGVPMIRDTRPCAGREWRPLDPVEGVVLETFRVPGPVAQGLARAAAELAANPPEWPESEGDPSEEDGESGPPEREEACRIADPAGAASAAFARLVEDGCLLTDRDRAVSIVVESGRRELPEETRTFPGGYVKPRRERPSNAGPGAAAIATPATVSGDEATT